MDQPSETLTIITVQMTPLQPCRLRRIKASTITRHQATQLHNRLQTEVQTTSSKNNFHHSYGLITAQQETSITSWRQWFCLICTRFRHQSITINRRVISKLTTYCSRQRQVAVWISAEIATITSIVNSTISSKICRNKFLNRSMNWTIHHKSNSS